MSEEDATEEDASGELLRKIEDSEGDDFWKQPF